MSMIVQLFGIISTEPKLLGFFLIWPFVFVNMAPPIKSEVWEGHTFKYSDFSHPRDASH